jgi:serine/threonine protein kinase
MSGEDANDANDADNDWAKSHFINLHSPHYNDQSTVFDYSNPKKASTAQLSSSSTSSSSSSNKTRVFRIKPMADNNNKGITTKQKCPDSPSVRREWSESFMSAYPGSNSNSSSSAAAAAVAISSLPGRSERSESLPLSRARAHSLSTQESGPPVIVNTTPLDLLPIGVDPQLRTDPLLLRSISSPPAVFTPASVTAADGKQRQEGWQRRRDSVIRVQTNVRNISAWSVKRVVHWLRSSVELKMYADKFSAHSINGAALINLDQERLSEMGITKKLSQLKLLMRIEEIVESEDAEAHMASSGSSARAPQPQPPAMDGLWSRITNAELTDVQSLGEGCFGWTKRATYTSKETGVTMQVVIKVPKNKPGYGEMQELKTFLAVPRHKCVLELLGLCTDFVDVANDTVVDACCLVTRYIERGSLKEMLAKGFFQELPRSKRIQKTFFAIALHTVQGLIHLHNHGIIHRDLAARNVLVATDMCALLADFGLARHVDTDNMTSYYTLTTDVLLPLRWLSPESLLSNKFSRQSDVWMLGVLLWEVTTNGRVLPYSSCDNALQLATQVVTGKLTLAPPANCPDSIKQLIRECLMIEPRDRPELSDIAHRLQLLHDNAQVDEDEQEEEQSEPDSLLHHDNQQNKVQLAKESVGRAVESGGGGGYELNSYTTAHRDAKMAADVSVDDYDRPVVHD